MFFRCGRCLWHRRWNFAWIFSIRNWTNLFYDQLLTFVLSLWHICSPLFKRRIEQWLRGQSGIHLKLFWDGNYLRKACFGVVVAFVACDTTPSWVKSKIKRSVGCLLCIAMPFTTNASFHLRSNVIALRVHLILFHDAKKEVNCTNSGCSF